MSPGPYSTDRDFTLTNITVRYDTVCALDDVSIQLNAGEAVGLVGPSGAGKTSLLRIMNGTIRPTAGSVRVGNDSVTELSERGLRRLRERIGFVHQDLGLVRNLRAIQNVMAGRLGRRTLFGSLRSLLFPSRSEAREVYTILDRVGIADKIYERTDHLSGGEQQRVAVARALYQDPIALLADEPVASVDPARAHDLVSLLCEVSRERELTLCMSLHNLELAREFFPRLIGLRGGRIAFDKPTADIADDEFKALYAFEPSDTQPPGTRTEDTPERSHRDSATLPA